MFLILLLYMCVQGTGAVIYRLNASEYARMPPVMHMDSYERCELDAHALYCSVEFALVSDTRSALLDIIKEYSEHRVKHYNHTKLRYGICVTQTCKKNYNNKTEDLAVTLEECLNETFREKYDLSAKIVDRYNCFSPGKPMKAINQLDIMVAVVCAIILLASLVGCFCDFFIKNEDSRVLNFLLCFSLKRNWNKLMAPVPVGRDPPVERLMCFHGMRVLNMVIVIIAHSLYIVFMTIENSEFIEKMYVTFPWNMILNASVIMQTFLLTSSFLLVYNWMSEENEPCWSKLPKQFLIRWLRVTPGYAVTLALTATWFGHLGAGPLWAKSVSVEMYECRRYWWRNLLYINNYFPSQCMVQSWYLATDIQLYCLALIIYIACRTHRSRVITLSFLFIVGIIIPAVHVYLDDLDGIQMLSPELVDTIFMNDPHFKAVYIRSHTNIPGSVIGIALGYLVYYWQKQKVDVTKYKTLRYRIMYWCLVPLVALCFSAGILFYVDAPRSSVYFRAASSALLRPMFALNVSGLAVGFIFKFEDVYRCFIEWRGWVVLSRLTYGAYLMHMALIRNHVAMQTHTNHFTLILVVEVILTILIFAFVAAFVQWMLVEAPVDNIVKEYLQKTKVKEVGNETTMKLIPGCVRSWNKKEDAL